MSYQWIVLEKEESIATIILNRPDRMNSLIPPMRVEIRHAIEDIAADDTIRVLILTGTERAFCAGADVTTVAEQTELAEDEPGRERLLQPIATGRIVFALQKLNKPTIAAINGVAAGSGTALALACDIIVASDQARFRIAFTRMGLSPGDGVSYFLPRAVGLHKALELVYTNEIVEAVEMERIGLVNKVVPHTELMKVAKEMAVKIAQMPPLTLALAKQVVYQSDAAADFESQMTSEMFRIKVLQETEDHKEAARSFIEKRQPVYRGR
ncbi:MAG: enoyl-CoA hydratase-related protein [Chloroflexota bacterium]|nr:enoyl-CoA hydratase-related protein [Chloroflexota bacterium]